MSSESHPPRKKHKTDSGSSRVLRSDSITKEDNSQDESASTPISTPKRRVRNKRPNNKTMSESRRRSSRKSRNDELRNNEQNIVASGASARGTPNRKHSSNKVIEASMHDEDAAGDFGEGDSTEDEDNVKAELEAGDEEERAMLEEERFVAQHRARTGGFGFGAMAGLFSNQSSQLKSLLASLRMPDPSVQLIALNELATILSMSTEDSLAGYMQVDAFVAELVNIMRGPNAFGEDNPEMMLLACRCLANLMEALPASTANIAYGGAIPVLCQKLLEIQFIDLAEQALSTLEKISKEYPSSVVREGGLAACLTYLDFFSTNVQRIAVNTAANCAKNIPVESFPIVRDVIPVLQNVIVGSDAKVVEAGCLCLTRIIESFRNHPARLEELLNSDLLRDVLHFISPDRTSGNIPSDFIITRFLHILGLAAKASSKLSSGMIKGNIVGTIYQLLTGLSKPVDSAGIRANSVVVLQALIHRPREQITEVLTLISELLPGLPDEDAYRELTTKERGSLGTRVTLFQNECAVEYEEFATIILPTLLDLYNSTVNNSLRKMALISILKLCYNLETSVFTRVVTDVPLAVFITGVLGSPNENLVLAGIGIATILLRRVQHIYAEKLATEGCVAELRRLESNYSKFIDASLPTAHERPSELDTISSVTTDIRSDPEDAFQTDEHNDVHDEDNEEDGEDDDEDDEMEEDDDDDDDLEDEEDEDDEIEEAVFTQALLHEDGPSLQSYITQARPDEEAKLNDPPINIVPILISQRSKLFLTEYTLVSQALGPNDKVLLDLKAIADDLGSTGTAEAFDKLSTVMTDSDGISSYFLLSSGILQTLRNVLTNSHRLENRRLFLSKCMNNSCLAVLVHKSQEILSRAERFEVTTTSSNDEKRSASVLAKQLRLKLVADESTDVPRPFRNLMVSIHAIATFKALDDYLRPRIAIGTSSSSRGSRAATPSIAASALLGRAPEGLQGALAQLAAAGASLPESVRQRLAGLGVDTSALLGTQDSNESESMVPSGLVDEADAVDEDDEMPEAGPPVSVEVPTSGGKAIAKNAEGQRILTPRVSTPTDSPSKRHAGNDAGKTALESAQAKVGSTKSSVMSYAAAVNSAPKDWHIRFEVNGQVVPHDTTIYGAISNARAVGDDSTHGRPLSSVYEVRFRKVQGPQPLPTPTSAGLPKFGEIPASIENETEAAPILQLLDVLYSMNSDWKDFTTSGQPQDVQSLPLSSFVNTKLTAKLNRQLEEPLIVASQCLPSWSQDLPRFYPFLFPFETRYLFLQSTSFGYSRSMTRWQSAAKKDREDDRSFLGRLQRQKVRISRPRMLESAMKVMELYGASPSVLEVEYFDEVGTGLGPTLEFYSTVSKEFAKRRLNIWRDHEHSESEYVFSPEGLFPRPLPLVENDENIESTKRTLNMFKTMGIFVARAMLDSRIIDISFNPTFFRLLADIDELPTTLGAIYNIDKSLAKSLSFLQKFATSYQTLMSEEDLDETGATRSADAIQIDGVSIGELGLDFTYPGLPEVELMPGGSQVDVEITNVSEYLNKVIEITLGSGIQRQLESFREGFSQVFPYSAMRAFTPTELTMIFGRPSEDWSVETLADSIKADHGYTKDSTTIRNLIQVLSEFSEVDRRSFLQFITGSPKLPIGGFKSLTPQFTVVCKMHESPLVADDYLPSVMTCVNYLKLPDYSEVEILRGRLQTAMREGGGSFHLS